MANNDVQEEVRKLRDDFQNLYEVNKQRQEIVQAQHGPAIEKLLRAAGYKVTQPVVSGETDHAAHSVTATLGAPQYAFHVEPHRDSDKSKADKLEVVDANRFVKWGDGGTLDYLIHRFQAVEAYAPLVIRRNPYKLPKKKGDESVEEYLDRVDRWRHEYQELRLEVAPVETVAFFEDGRLNVTLFVEEYQQAVSKFVEDYGEYDKEAYAAGELDPSILFTVYQEQFANIRATYSFSDKEDAFWGQDKVTICSRDDGRTISRYIKSPNGGGLEAISDMGKEGRWPNPYGRPLLFPVPGRWNPEAVLPEMRYKPLLQAQIISRWNLDMSRSEWMSKAAEKTKWGAAMSPEMMRELTALGSENEMLAFFERLERTQIGREVVMYPAEPKPMRDEPGDYHLQVYQEIKEEHQQFMPQAAFSGSANSQSLLKTAAASSLLRFDEISDQSYDEARKWKYMQYIRIAKASDTYWKTNANGPNKPGAESPEKLYVTTVGQEKVQGKAVGRGMKIEMEPSSFDFPFDRSIIQVDNRASSVAARLGVVAQRQQMELILPEEKVEALGIEDSEEYLRKLRAQKRYDNVFQINDALTLAASLRVDAIELGVDTTQLLAQMSGTPSPQPGAEGDTTNPYQMAPPRRDGGQVESVA